MRLALTGVLVLVSVPQSIAYAAPPGPGEVAKTVDAYTKPLVERGDLSGQLLILRNGLVLVERNFGVADREQGVAITPETRFNVASVTKPMTGTLAIQLIQEKKLNINDPISRWFPDFPKGDSITVEHLLRHRSGIPHEIMPDSVMTRPFTAGEIVNMAKALPLDFSPGAQERYSSGGFEVLARILELASGMSYPELIHERIFGPLGMKHSSSPPGRVALAGRASDYVPGPKGLENAPFQDFSGIVGAGSVWSTARDLHTFVEAVVSGKFGEGVRQSYVRQGRVNFNGRTAGFKAWAMWDSTTGVEAIFAGNVATGAPDALKRDVLDLAQGKSVPAPQLPAIRKTPLPETELRSWEGTYHIEHGPRITLAMKGVALYANEWVLWPGEDGSMFSPRDYGIVRLVRDDGGKVLRLDWTQGSDTYPAPLVH